MQFSNVPVKFTIPWANGASSTYVTDPIPTPSQISTNPGNASFTDGFTPQTFAVGGAPLGKDTNGILQMITAWSRWYQAGVAAQYDGTFSAAIGGYPKGSFLKATSGNGVWLSTADNNTSNPDTGGANWVKPFALLNSDGTISATAAASSGEVVTLGQGDARYAALNGNAADAFAVANATAASQAVNLGQLSGLFGTVNVFTTSTRTLGTTYTNSTGRPMFLSVSALSMGATQNLIISVAGNTVSMAGNNSTGVSIMGAAMIPNGATYVVQNTGGGTFQYWTETN